MTVRFNLLFVSDDPRAHSGFQESLWDTGLRVISMHGTEGTVLGSSNGRIDGVVVYHEDVQASGAVALQLKALLRNVPVVLICTGHEMALSFGIDAVCYTNSLDDEMARIIAMLFRDLLIQQPYSGNVPLEHEDERPRAFLVQA